MKVITATAPSYWASYLINGDDSGLEMSEVRAANEWLAEVGLGDPVSCEECGFMRLHDAHWYAAAADCCEYAFFAE